MKRCLCVFLKSPDPGRVKTRLAESTGETNAAEIYKRLVCEVIRQVKKANPDEIAILFSPSEKRGMIEEWLRPWLAQFPGEISFFPQCDGDLGDRLRHATELLFKKNGRTGLLIVGTDCIELDRSLLLRAWEYLEKNDGCVLGPSTDGGYYLIGLSHPATEVFENIPWSTEKTLEATLKRASFLNLECFLLPEKTDIDTFNEYRLFKDRLKRMPCVFFDRDGVVNQSPGPGYVLKKEDFHLSEGIIESLETVNKAGYLSVVVTSQKGVGKGLMTEEDLSEIHHDLQSTLGKAGLGFDHIYAFTGKPDCTYEAKPDPSMIHAAAEDYPIDLEQSWLVGDADRDIEMGQKAGLRGTIRIRGDKPISSDADHTIDSILALPKLLRKVL